MKRFLKPAEPVEIAPADVPAAGTPLVRCMEVAQERIRQEESKYKYPLLMSILLLYRLPAALLNVLLQLQS